MTAFRVARRCFLLSFISSDMSVHFRRRTGSAAFDAAISHISFGDKNETFRSGAFGRTLAAAALFVTSFASNAFAADTTYPLTLKNCGRDVTFKHAPECAVAVGQSSAEIMYLLGLGDKMVGTAVWIGPVLKGYEEANAKVKRLADNDPSFESVLAESRGYGGRAVSVACGS